MFWLLLLSILAASVNSVVLHKAKLTDSVSVYRYNLISAFAWCICLLVVNGCKLHIDSSVLPWGMVYGITQALFILFKTLAMNNGPVSVTTLVGNCSLVVSVFTCFFLWDEPVSLADIAGLILLMIGIVLTTYKKAERDFTKSWKIYTLFFLLFAAGVGITFKAFSKNGNPSSAGDMMLVSSIVMLLSYTIICAFLRGSRKRAQATNKNEQIAFLVCALFSGLLSCVYNRLNIYLSGVLDGVIFFPSFNGGVIVLSTLISMVLLKEDLKLKQMIGILLGILAICIIGIL